MSPLECDYLVIGAGAVGMAFVDELVYRKEDETLTFIMIDKFHQPGGHWLKAYDYATLQHPAAYYGVKSRKLETEELNDLSTAGAIRYYYDQVMKGFLATGRVQFFPQCEYRGDNVVRSLLDPDHEYKISIKKKIVDAHYSEAYRNIPASNKPSYKVSEDIPLVPLNRLSDTSSPWQRYVIIGAGKSAIDAVLHLLRNSVNPDRVVWIRPNDYWLFNRQHALVGHMADGFLHDVQTIIDSENYQQLLQKWEEAEYILRIDPTVTPTRWKAPVVSLADLEQLRRVENVIREGRVESIESHRIVFENGNEIRTNTNTLHVDCSSNGEPCTTAKPIWEDDTITLQFTEQLLPMYSATCIAALEEKYPDEEEKKNGLLVATPYAQTLQQFVRLMPQGVANGMCVAQELGGKWLRSNRLWINSHIPAERWGEIVERNTKLGSQIDEAFRRIIRTIRSDP